MTGELDRSPALLAVLETIRRQGSIGERSLADGIAHAERFVDALPRSASTLVDLGSGGGLPGLVIAVRRPELRITLVERRQTRADQLRRAVSALDLTSVDVVGTDVGNVARDRPHGADVVTARSFASPEITARWAGALLRPGGLALVSEPPQPTPTRWPTDLLDGCGLVDQGVVNGLRHLRSRI